MHPLYMVVAILIIVVLALRIALKSWGEALLATIILLIVGIIMTVVQHFLFGIGS